MQNLLLFLVRYGAFLSFVFLEAICFYLVVNYNDNQRGIYLYSSNVASGKVYKRVQKTKDYLALDVINDSLSQENARLKAILLKRELTPSDSIRLISNLEYNFTSARVINNSVDRRNNTITIDKGSASGIKKSQGVLGDNGIVGIVGSASEHFASVYSVLHSSIKVSGKVGRTDYFGNLSWDGKDIRYLQLEAVPKHADLSRGDTIKTTAYSTVFPPNIPIGIIEDFQLEQGRNDYQIRVRMINDLANTTHVYVTYLIKSEERIELEKEMQDE